MFGDFVYPFPCDVHQAFKDYTYPRICRNVKKEVWETTCQCLNEHIICQSKKTNPTFSVVALSDLVSTINTLPEEDGNEIEITARDHNDTAVMDKQKL